jgi:hypothetical protein
LAGILVKKLRVPEAAVALTTLGVEDPELGPSPRRPIAAPCDDGFRALTDDVAPQAQPGASGELEPESRRLGNRGRETRRQAGRLEDDEEGLGPAGEAGETTQPLGDLRPGRPGDRTSRKIDHEDVHGAAGEEHPGDRESLVEGFGSQDDEPVQPDAARRGLDRVERPGKIQPGDDRAVRLGLGDEPEGEGGGTRAGSAAKGDARAPWQPARADDGVKSGKAGPDDPLDAGSRLARRSGDPSELGWVVGWLGRKRCRRQRSDHLGSCSTPSRLEGRQSSRHVRGEAGHRTVRLEQTFDIVNGSRITESR